MRLALAIAAGFSLAGLASAGRAGGLDAARDALSHCAAPVTDKCLADIEAQALKEAAGRARRDGRWLSLQTTTGPVRFDDQRAVDSPASAGTASTPLTRRNIYLGTVDDGDAQLVLSLAPGAPLASARYWLVGAAGPPVLPLDDLPWPSPGGRLLAVVKPAEKSRPSTLALYVRAGARWSLQYRYEAPPGLSYHFKSWRADAAALRLEWQWQWQGKACKAQEEKEGSVQLRDGPYGWDLVPPLPPGCP